MRQLFFLIALLSLQLCFALYQPLPRVPQGWKMESRADPEQDLLVHIAVKQQNTEVLERKLFQVSDPDSPLYGKHLSFEQVNELVKPRPESIRAVFSFLEEKIHHFDASHVQGTANWDMVQLVLPVRLMENLFQAKYFVFKHLESGKTVTRSLKFFIPQELKGHVDFVGPSTRFPTVQKLKTRELAEGEEAQVTPSFLRSLYSLGSYTTVNQSNQQSVTGFLDQYIKLSDLSTFFRRWDNASEGRVPQVVGPNKESDPGVEASLDIQYVMAMGHAVNTTFWSTAGRQPHSPENEPFLTFLLNVANDSNPPFVFSISYGDNEDTVELSYAKRVNVEFQKLGARGITITASSGDGGVAGSQPSLCSKFIPTFPAASPYVTAVGGTHSSGPEKAADLSAGGFSNRWARPSYQTADVEHYFQVARNLPSSDKYNSTGAGFPDVAAQAEDFVIVYDGVNFGVSGTSCSSPTFAGIVASLNDVRLRKGKSTLGYLNVLLYKNPDAFNDVTSGHNPGCSTEGFYAAQGWDPVTGLGTPNFLKLSSVVSQLA